MADVVLRGKVNPAVQIYDLDPIIEVHYEEEVTLTLDQYVSSAVAQFYVENHLLQMLSGPSILPRTVLLTDIDPQTFNIRQRVVKYDHLDADLQALLDSLSASGYYWLTDPGFTEDPTHLISFNNASLFYLNKVYNLFAGSIGPATQNSLIIGTLNETLSLLTVRLEPLTYVQGPNEIIIGSYDFSNNRVIVPGGTSVEAEDVSYDNSVSLIPATTVQAAIDYLSSVLGPVDETGTDYPSWSVNKDRTAEPELAFYLKRNVLTGDPEIRWSEGDNVLYIDPKATNAGIRMQSQGTGNVAVYALGGGLDLRGDTAAMYGTTAVYVASPFGTMNQTAGGVNLSSSTLPVSVVAANNSLTLTGNTALNLNTNGLMQANAINGITLYFNNGDFNVSGSNNVIYSHGGVYDHTAALGFNFQSPYFVLDADAAGTSYLNGATNHLEIGTAALKNLSLIAGANLVLDASGQISIGEKMIPDSAHDLGDSLNPFGDIYANDLIIPGGVFKADGSVTATGHFDMGNFKITNLADPSNPQDAATLAWVQAYLQGYIYKSPVRLATTAAGTLATDFENGDTLDTKTLVTGDRILIKNQADPVENGIYIVNISGAPTRATDADEPGELAGGMTVFVEDGDVNKDTGWVVTSDGSLTPGTDPILWGQIFGPGAVIAGAGLGQSGNTIFVNVKSDGSIEIVSDELAVKLNGTTLSSSASGLSVNQSSLSLNSISGILSAAKGGTGLDTSLSTGFPRITSGTWSVSGITTTDVTEGTRLYYTDERVDDRVANLLIAGTGINLNYDDILNTLTVSVIADTTIQRVRGSYGGVFVAARQELNFISGSNMTGSVVDNGPNNRLDITYGVVTSPTFADVNITGLTTNLNGADVSVKNQIVGIDTYFQHDDFRGFVNRTDSTLTYNVGTQTFNISGTYTYYNQGKRYIKTAVSENVIHANTTGTYYVYYSGATLVVSTSPWDWQLHTPVAYIYYNNTGATTLWAGPDAYILDERHGLMDWRTHRELHNAVGSVVAGTGFALNGTYVVASGTGGLVDTTYGIDGGTFLDEDIEHTLATLSDNDGVGNQYNCLYRAGAGTEWRWYDNNLPFLTQTNNILWNQYTGGAWQLTEATGNNDYVNVYVCGVGPTPAYAAKRFAFLLGQNLYTSLAGAQEETILSLDLGGFPFIEIVPLYKITMRRANAYSTASGHARIEQIQKIIGTRLTLAVSGASPSIHNNLSGRSDAACHPATSITVDTTLFTKTLSSTDDTVQKALDTLDDHTHLSTDVTDFDEAAQDAVGAMVVDTNTVSLSYVDATPSLSASVNYQNTTTVNLSEDVSGLKADVVESGLTLNNIGGVLSITKGGTGQTTALAAFNALSPLTTRGDLLTRDTTNNIRLALGSANTVLRSNGTDPAWGAVNLATDVTGTLGPTNGGTGQTTVTTGDLLYGSGTNVWGKLAAVATGNALISGGVGVAPSWGKIGLATHVSGVLPADSGGTGQSAYTIGDIIYASGVTALSKLADVATGNALISGGVGVAPSWGKVGLTTHVTGLLPFANLADGSALSVLGRSVNSTGVMASIAAGSDGQVLRRSGTTLGFGAVDLANANAITGDLPFANLTQGLARSVLGVAGNATADVASIQGGANQVLVVNAGGTALGFGAVNLASGSAVTGLLPFANMSDLAAYSVLGRASSTSGVMAAITAGTDNQVLRRSGTSVGFGAVNLASTDAVTGTLPVTNGGTGLSSITASRLLWSSALNTLSEVSLGTGLQVSGGALSVVANTTNQQVRVSNNGALVGTRREINFIPGTNVTLNVVDNGGSDRVDVTINATAGGSGDVVGPASATDNAIARYDLTTGKLIQNSTAILDDLGNLSGLNDLYSVRYIMGSGPDFSAIPVVSGQSVLTSYWGLQLVGNKRSTVDYTPSNMGAAGDYGIAIPAQQVGSIAVGIRGASGQTGDLITLENNAGTVLTRFTAAGYLGFNVTPAANSYIHIHDTGTGNTQGLRVTNASTGIGATDGMFFGLNGDEQGMVWLYETDDLIFGTANTERMRIEDGGNVSIGLASDAVSKLQVHDTGTGNVGIRITNATTGATATDGLYIGLQDDETAQIWMYDNENMVFATNNAERIRIQSGGNVSIGTTSNIEMLAVEGRIALRETTAPSATANYGKLYVKSSDSNLYFMNDSGTEYQLTPSGGGGETHHLYGSLCAQANSTYGLLSKHCVDTNNPSGKPLTTPYSTYGNGDCDPYVIANDSTITEVHLSVAAVAVSQTTVGSTPTLRINFYSHSFSSRTLLGSADVLMDNTNVSTSNNLGNDDFQIRSLAGLTIDVPAGTLLGFEFQNRSATNNEINAVSRLSVCVHVQED